MSNPAQRKFFAMMNISPEEFPSGELYEVPETGSVTSSVMTPSFEYPATSNETIRKVRFKLNPSSNNNASDITLAVYILNSRIPQGTKIADYEFSSFNVLVPAYEVANISATSSDTELNINTPDININSGQIALFVLYKASNPWHSKSNLAVYKNNSYTTTEPLPSGFDVVAINRDAAVGKVFNTQ